MKTVEDYIYAGLEMVENCFDLHGFEMDAPNCFPAGSTVKKLSFFRYSGTTQKTAFREF